MHGEDAFGGKGKDRRRLSSCTTRGGCGDANPAKESAGSSPHKKDRFLNAVKSLCNKRDEDGNIVGRENCETPEYRKFAPGQKGYPFEDNAVVDGNLPASSMVIFKRNLRKEKKGSEVRAKFGKTRHTQEGTCTDERGQSGDCDHLDVANHKKYKADEVCPEGNSFCGEAPTMTGDHDGAKAVDKVTRGYRSEFTYDDSLSTGQQVGCGEKGCTGLINECGSAIAEKTNAKLNCATAKNIAVPRKKPRAP